MLRLRLVRERGLEPLKRDYLASRFQTCCVCQFRHSRTSSREGRRIFGKISFPALSDLGSRIDFNSSLSFEHFGDSIEKCRNATRLPTSEFFHFYPNAHVEMNCALGSFDECRRDHFAFGL